jgi:ATP-dependent Clp protease ATP-binding subunit ClpA
MNLFVPLLVQESKRPGSGKPVFFVRPLFVPSPAESDEQLGRAITKLARSLRHVFDELGKHPRHDEQRGLADWTFNPDLRDQTVDVDVELRHQTAKLRFPVVTFEALGRTIGFVPPVEDVWFDVPRGATVRELARDAITEHLRRLEKDSDEPTEFEVPVTLTRATRQWLDGIELDASPRPAVEKTLDLSRFFSLGGGGERAGGRQELMKVGRCLDWLYPDDLDRAVLREAQVAELTRLLASRDRRPVLLVGPRRAGKTTIVHECVFRRVQKRLSPHVSKNNVWLLAPQRLISGMMYVGQWEDRLLAIMREAKKRDHVLYFDDLLGLYHAGVSASSDLNVAHVMRPYVERHDFRLLGEITPDALRVLREQDRGFADVFHVLPVDATSEPQTRRILVNVQRQLEGRHRCRFDLDALPAVTDLQHRYVRELAEPGKSAGFLRGLALKHARQDVTRRTVLDDFHAHSGLSVTFLDTAARLERKTVAAALGAQLVGQNAAVAAMADVVTVAKARLNDPGRPLATMLFLGPTGVGKTQAAKALAQYLFGDGSEQRLLRFDMNEYVEPGSAGRLVGTFQEPEGLLTSRIRRQPFAVLLLDEIEKADPGVFDLLLQVLGEGRLTDALGRTADFTNCVILLTSNLGVREAGSTFGLRPGGESNVGAAHGEVFVAAAERFFRPEFFNRIDRVVPFASLAREDIGRIADLLIADVFRREGLVHRRCALRVEPEAMRRIVQDGYHPQLGARALKRSIERALTRPVAARLAAMAHDAPAVITLFARAGRELVAHVEPMAEAAPLAPAAPPHADPDDALDGAEAAVTRVEHTIAALEPRGGLRQDQLGAAAFRYLALREHARHLRRRIDRIDRLLEQRRRKPVARSGVVRNPGAMSYKRTVVRRNDRFGRSMWKELMAAESTRAHLADDVFAAGEPVEEIEASLAELAQDAALLEAMSAESEGNDRCLLLVRPLTSGSSGEWEMLAAAYASAFDPKFHHFTAEHIDAGGIGEPVALVRVEMPGCRRIFAGEEGTHLFLPAAGGTLPVQVFVFPLGADDAGTMIARKIYARRAAWRTGLNTGSGEMREDPFRLAPVVRVYDATRGTVDLRTGAVAPAEASALDVRRLMLASLPVPIEMLE